MCGWSPGPDELAVLVAFCQYAHKARLAVIYTSDVFWGDAGILPGGGNGGAHNVFRSVSGASVEAVDSCYCAAGNFV